MAEGYTNIQQMIHGWDFLAISDTNAHTGVFTGIWVMADAVFDEILIEKIDSATEDCVTAKGLSGLTVPAGTFLPFGQNFAKSIQLTSGTVLALKA